MDGRGVPPGLVVGGAGAEFERSDAADADAVDDDDDRRRRDAAAVAAGELGAQPMARARRRLCSSLDFASLNRTGLNHNGLMFFIDFRFSFV